MMFKSLLLTLLFFSSDVKADDTETLVYGAAARPDGGENVFVVAQPNNLENPLGNPIESRQTPTQVFGPSAEEKQSPAEKSEQLSSSQTQNSPTLEANSLGKDFQNTLLEANDRVYDIQSYPLEDMKVMGNPSQPETIYSPNVNAP